jgi:hypothetical protein
MSDDDETERSSTHPHESFLQSWILAAIQEDTSSFSWFDPFFTTLLVVIVVPIAVVALYWVHKTRKR